MADVVTAAWIGVIVGGILATLWPYYNVWKASNGATKFDWNYILSLVVSTLIAMPSAIVLYGVVVGAIPPSLAAYSDSPWFLFAFGVFIGSGANRLLNEKVVDKGG